MNVRITARFGPRCRFRAGRERRTRFRPSVRNGIERGCFAIGNPGNLATTNREVLCRAMIVGPQIFGNVRRECEVTLLGLKTQSKFCQGFCRRFPRSVTNSLTKGYRRYASTFLGVVEIRILCFGAFVTSRNCFLETISKPVKLLCLSLSLSRNAIE